MATYTVIPGSDRTFAVAIIGNDGARQTLLGFESEEDAQAWIAGDRCRSATADLRTPRRASALLQN